MTALFKLAVNMRNLLMVMCIFVMLNVIIQNRWTTSDKPTVNKNARIPEVNSLGIPRIHERRFLDVRASRWTSDIAFHRYLTSPDVTCNKSFRAGRKGDGGWYVCLTEPFVLKPPCLVYSFGINYDYSFDDAVANNFNCTVKSFDPSMKKTVNHKRGKHIHFFKDGISGKNFINKRGWHLYSLATILKTHNDSNRIIDCLKMDVEGSEWDAIPDMATKGILDNVKQICLEIHRKKGDTKSVHMIGVLEDNGFRKWKMDYNFHCGYNMTDGNHSSTCIELYYINTRFIGPSQRNNFMLE